MIRCMIVDDEQPARALIQQHLAHLPDFLLMASFENAVAAFNFLQQHTIDLLFLDIQLPGISGLQLIQSLKEKPAIILTTAYREHAVEAFELEVLDYLVKPITQDRFMKAIAKFNYYHNSLGEKQQPADRFNEAYIFFKIGNQQTKIFLKDILYIEGLKDYVKVYTQTKTIVASERLSYLEEKLPEQRFARIHKSYIVGLANISVYTSDQVTIGNSSLPIGRAFKQVFLKKLLQ